jgi:hypothetical protein
MKKPTLVIEYHYDDGDIGAHFIEEDTDVYVLWAGRANRKADKCTHFLIRPATAEDLEPIPKS